MELDKLKSGYELEGFTLLDNRFVKSIECNVLLFEHNKTKAKLTAIKNNDDNKAFNISFKTLPDNSTGVAHVLEHCVLSGSKKYPVKDVFGELIKGGLSTFLNAYTAPDNTSYPFATRNTKEFFNLLDVYLDTTLNPLLTQNTFEQEGWHHELLDCNEKIQFKGIVYNEMKGAMSDPIQQLLKLLKSNLLQETIYAHNSGGEPENITDLTYNDFKNFHKKYYHPSNSVISLYGNGVLEDELKYINGFLKEFEYEEVIAKIDDPLKIDELTIKHESYAVNSNDIADKSLVGFAYNVGTIEQLEQSLALSLLSNVIFNSEASPVKNKLLESGLVRDLSAFFYDTIKFTSLYLFLHGANNSKDSAKKLNLILETELRKLVKSGIDKKLLISEFNSLELAKEEEIINANKFLIYISQSKYAMMHNYDIYQTLDIMSILRSLKEKITTTNYLEDLIQKFLLDNLQKVVIQLSPDPKKAAEKEKREQDKLENYKNSLSETKLQEIVDKSKKLLETQNTPESAGNLALIPKISTKDVKPSNFFELPSVSKIDKYDLLYSEQDTNNLIYFNLGFNLNTLPEKYLAYTNIFSELLSGVGTKDKSFQELSKEIFTCTGGLRTQLKFYTQKEDKNKFKSFFWLGTKFVKENLNKALDLIFEILTTLDLDNKDKIKEIILKIYNHKESDFQSSGMGYVIKKLAYYQDLPGQLVEKSVGFENLKFLKKLVTEFDNNFLTLQTELKSLQRFFLNLFSSPENILIHLTTNDNCLNSVKTDIAEFLGKFKEFESLKLSKNSECELQNLKFKKPKIVNEAFLSDSDIVYAGKGANLYDFGLKYHGSFEIVLKFLNLDYLMHQIRVLGGAYGVMVSFAEKRGLIYLCSYRDPNVKETYDAYDNIGKALDEFKMNDKDFDYLKLGAYGDFNQLHSPIEKGEISRDNYLGGYTPEFYMNIMKEILDANQNDLKKYKDIFEKMSTDGYISIIGNKTKIENEKERFDALLTL